DWSSDVCSSDLKYWLFSFLALTWNHGDSFFFSRANADTYAATHTIHRRYSHSELVLFQTFADHLSSLQTFWCSSSFCLGQSEWTDGSMWADIRTTVTLDTFACIPLRNHNSNAAFFVREIGRAHV